MVNKKAIIRELRHQLYYSKSSDREDIRRQLDFWIHYRPDKDGSFNR